MRVLELDRGLGETPPAEFATAGNTTPDVPVPVPAPVPAAAAAAAAAFALCLGLAPPLLSRVVTRDAARGTAGESTRMRGWWANPCVCPCDCDWDGGCECRNDCGCCCG